VISRRNERFPERPPASPSHTASLYCHKGNAAIRKGPLIPFREQLVSSRTHPPGLRRAAGTMSTIIFHGNEGDAAGDRESITAAAWETVPLPACGISIRHGFRLPNTYRYRVRDRQKILESFVSCERRACSADFTPFGSAPPSGPTGAAEVKMTTRGVPSWASNDIFVRKGLFFKRMVCDTD